MSSPGCESGTGTSPCIPILRTALLQCVAGDPILLEVDICCSICDKVRGLSLALFLVAESMGVEGSEEVVLCSPLLTDVLV